MKHHSFKESNKETEISLEIRKEAYSMWFHRMEGDPIVLNCKGDGWDVMLDLSGTKSILIEEKIRRKRWNDFHLETRHVYDNGHQVSGWIYKDTNAKYLAYVFKPTWEFFIMPWHRLMETIERNPEWFEREEVESQNNRYVSCGVCINEVEFLRELGRNGFYYHKLGNSKEQNVKYMKFYW